MQVSVVIATLDRPAILTDCLRGVLAELGPGDEIIVVAQGTGLQRQATIAAAAAASGATSDPPDTSGSPAGENGRAGREMRAGVPLLVVVEEPEPNLPAARNLGLRRASSPVVIFLDDDAVPLPGWTAALVGPFEAGADLVAGRLVEEPDLTTNAPRLTGARLTCTGHTRRNYNTPASGSSGLAPGGNMAVRRVLALSAGGFDDSFGRGAAVYEDTEFAERIRRRGGRVVYAGAAAVEHRAVRSGGCWSVAEGERDIDRARNMSALFQRHRSGSWPIMAGAYIGAAKWKVARRRLRWRTLLAIVGALAEGRRIGRRRLSPLTPAPRLGREISAPEAPGTGDASSRAR